MTNFESTQVLTLADCIEDFSLIYEKEISGGLLEDNIFERLEDALNHAFEISAHALLPLNLKRQEFDDAIVDLFFRFGAQTLNSVDVKL